MQRVVASSWRVRCRRGVGTESISGFRPEKAARRYISDTDTGRRRGTWIDPAGSGTTFSHLVERWFPSLDLDPRTLEHYRSYLRRRRGRSARRITREKPWASPEQVLRIADQAGALGGRIARLLIITAGWTGCRVG